MNPPFRALTSEDAKKKKKNSILHPQTPLYRFYHLILQLTQYSDFIFTYNSLK